jgi:hypothetical protein
MADRELRSFDEFWDFYVSEHKSKANRILHFIGTTAAMGCLATAAITRKKRFVLAAPVVGYGFAWVGHFFVEKNKPASFKHPLWSLRGDFKMWSLMVRGKMQAEVDRVIADERRRADATNGTTDAHAGAPPPAPSAQSEAVN